MVLGPPRLLLRLAGCLVALGPLLPLPLLRLGLMLRVLLLRLLPRLLLACSRLQTPRLLSTSQ